MSGRCIPVLAQARTLLDHCANHRLGSLFAVALSLGLRLGEALGLRWSDVDFNKELLHVRRSLQRIKGGVAFSAPKTACSNRTLVLPSVAIANLTTHRDKPPHSSTSGPCTTPGAASCGTTCRRTCGSTSRLTGEERENAVQRRDIVAGLMTPTQIAEAQRLAREWDAAHPQ